MNFEHRSVNKNSMQEIITVLSGIVEMYEDCVFDLTGIEDVCHVATDIVYERYKDINIQMHHSNIRNNTFQDCDMDRKTILEEKHPG